MDRIGGVNELLIREGPHVHETRVVVAAALINPEGKIIYEGAIGSKASPNPADIPSSTNYVKAALDESLAGKPVTTPSSRPYGCSVKFK